MQRRHVLSLGLLASAALVIGGALALLRPGLHQGRLSPAGREVCAAIGNALLDGSLPAQPAARKRALDELLARIDTLVAGLPPHAQSELSQLLALLASAGGRLALAGVRPEWPGATVGEVQQGLQAMRTSGLTLRRQAYQALHDIAGSAYFSDPSTWHALGYPGPRKI